LRIIDILKILSGCEGHQMPFSNGGRNMNPCMFPTIGFLVQQILGLVNFKKIFEKIFSLANIFTNLKRCHI
jgi:hypothetical protein